MSLRKDSADQLIAVRSTTYVWLKGKLVLGHGDRLGAAGSAVNETQGRARTSHATPCKTA